MSSEWRDALVNNLPNTSRGLMPLQLLQQDKSPFFGTGTSRGRVLNDRLVGGRVNSIRFSMRVQGWQRLC